LEGKIKILVSESDGFCLPAIRRLESLGELTLANLDRQALLRVIHDIDILWIRLRNYIDAQILDAAPNLKVIVTPTTGLTHIDLEQAEKRRIHILSLRGEVEFLKEIRATAEHTIGLMLALLRRIPWATEHVKAGGWERDLFRGYELFGKKVGVVGYGRLGRIVSRYLRSFDVEVLVNGSSVDSTQPDPQVTHVPLKHLLEKADMVTLHVNLTEENRGFFGSREFSTMKPGAWFINTSRGELIDERALLKSLTSGRLAGAALDVLSAEYSDCIGETSLVSYARNHSNLLITPHIGGCTFESMEKTETFLAERLSTLINSAEPRP
jgi:D-3-phosphoglycerate dehydrogenase